MITLGQYGVERWNAAGDEYRIPPDPAQISTLAEEVSGLLDSLGMPEARIEHKGGGRGVACHRR